jgi:hypothetical protein
VASRKNYENAYILLIAVVVTLFFQDWNVVIQASSNAPSNPTTQPLPDRNVSLQAAVNDADVIVTAKLDSLGHPTYSHFKYNYRIQATVSRTFKGSLKGSTFALDLDRSPASEAQPVEGQYYIFALKSRPASGAAFIKMVANTPDDAAIVEKLIAVGAETKAASSQPTTTRPEGRKPPAVLRLPPTFTEIEFPIIFGSAGGDTGVTHSVLSVIEVHHGKRFLSPFSLACDEGRWRFEGWEIGFAAATWKCGTWGWLVRLKW